LNAVLTIKLLKWEKKKKKKYCSPRNKKKWQTLFALIDFFPLGCYRPIKNIILYANFSQKPLILSKKVTRNFA